MSDSRQPVGQPGGEAVEGRVVFPLWAKLGLLFGGLVGAVIAVSGWVSFQDEMRQDLVRQRQKLVGLAETLAGAIDGDLHQTFRSLQDVDRPEFRRLRGWMAQAVRSNGLKWTLTLVRDPQGRLAYGVDSSDSPQPPGYPLFDINEAQLQAFGGRSTSILDVEDEWGRWDAAYAPVRNAAGQIVALVEVDSDADARDLLWATRARRLAIELLVCFALALLGSVAFTRTLSRDLASLTASARELGTGNFEHLSHIRSRDEIGLLGRTFNSMVIGLREREFIRETFGRFVTAEVVAKVLSNPESLRLGGEEKQVTILMSDLRGFTALSERLGPEGMVALLNRYFSRMAEVILAHDGMIDEFAGDGIVVLFGAPTSQPDDPLRAVACAVAMQRELMLFNLEEGLELEMGIGVNSGRVIAGNIGSEKRMKYGVVGDAINLAARLESFTLGSQVLVSEATIALVRQHVRTGPVQELLAKGKREPVRCALLLAVGPPYDVQLPERAPDTAGRDLQAPATCQRVDGKQVDALPLLGITTHLARHLVRLRTPWQPEPMSNLKLRIDLGQGQSLEELYGKVMAVQPTPLSAGAVQEGRTPTYEIELRLTSVPERERELLGELLGRG